MRYKNSSFSTEFNQYGDNELNVYKPIINEQTAKYKIEIRPVAGWVDFYISTNVMQSDSIYVTDFNSANRHKFTQVPIMVDGDVQPLFNNGVNELSPMELSFKYGRNSLRARIS